MTAAVAPRVILRLGSHAEKEYVEKTFALMDGLILGANLMEATPGATSSLVFRCATAKKPPMPVFIDPMTYAFGAYPDPETGSTRTDLDWIKSDQKVKGIKGVTERRFKRSYAALAKRFGGIFERALEKSTAVSLKDLGDSAARRGVVEAVIAYQEGRAVEEFQKDPEYAVWADQIPPPEAAFAPYFYLEPNNVGGWLAANLQLATDAAAAAKGRIPVHAVLCVDEGMLADDAFIDKVASSLPTTGVAGAWLWFSRFEEPAATLAQLQNYRQLVERLAEAMGVYALHGGFFSLALSRVGLAGVSHGVGYGEQKDVMPVIGQSTPTVRYYAPPLRTRTGVVEIERSFKAIGINSPADFFTKICGCVICRNIIGADLRNFATRFGARHYSTPDSRRQAQTPEAAKLCRFHFLLARFAERDWLKSATLVAIKEALSEAQQTWGKLPALQSPDHLERWQDALS